MLERGRTMMTVALYEDAARMSYVAAFHAAQALIFERDHKIAKSHHGVRSEFHRLVRNEKRIDDALRGFLAKSYEFKLTADYEPHRIAPIDQTDAAAALDCATRFVEALAGLCAG